jgi:hypothetical protein
MTKTKPTNRNARKPVRASRKAKIGSPAAKSAIAQLKSGLPASDSKLGTLIALLERKTGATLVEMVEATGWQAHSVRGAISGTIKKKLGLKVTSTTADGVRTYRLAR